MDENTEQPNPAPPIPEDTESAKEPKPTASDPNAISENEKRILKSIGELKPPQISSAVLSEAEKRIDEDEDARKKRLANDSSEQDMAMRKEFSTCIKQIVTIWLIFVGLTLWFVGFKDFLVNQCHLSFYLSDRVLITLIAGCSANIIGLLAIVARYLFSRKPTEGKMDSE